MEFTEVYYESACALRRLQHEDQYKVVAALCIMIDLPVPPRPRRRTGQTGSADR